MSDTTNPAADFMAAAEARVASRDRERADAARQQFGQLYDDFERELGAVLRAIARLPETLESRITVEMPMANSRNRFTFSIDCLKPHLSQPMNYNITGVADSTGVSLESDYSGGSDYSRTGSAKVSNFAEARPFLAQWLADNAPERLAELKALMIPDDGYTLKRNVVVSNPIRLKQTP